MSVFPSSKNLVSWAGCCLRNDKSNKTVKSTRISKVGSYLKHILVQIANAVIKSKDHPKFGIRYSCIKSHRGHKKAIMAICRMLLTVIWNVISKREPYSLDGYAVAQPSFVAMPLTKSQGLPLLRQMGSTLSRTIILHPSPITA